MSSDYPLWVNHYMGIPFVDGGRTRNEGCDCYGLVRLILQEQCSIHLPLYDALYHDTSERDKVDQGILIEISAEYWRSVLSPDAKMFDVVVFRVGDKLMHVGVMVNRTHMINVSSGVEVNLADIHGMLWGRRLRGIYRHKKHGV